MARENNFYDKKQYKTEQGIERYHTVEFEKPSTVEEFEKALEKLDAPMYKTIAGEKNRMPYYKKKFPLYGDAKLKNKKMESLVKSFLLSISPNLNIEDVDKSMYQIAHDNVHKIIYIPGEMFICTWIYKDVIYRDEFKLLNKDKIKSKLQVMKSMKAPFELSRTSINSTTIRLMFKKGWKRYIGEVERGLNTI